MRDATHLGDIAVQALLFAGLTLLQAGTALSPADVQVVRLQGRGISSTLLKNPAQWSQLW